MPADCRVAMGGLFLGYAAYNMLRKTWSLAIAQPSFTAELSITQPQIGTISSLHGAVYGLSKLSGSLLCDHLGPRSGDAFAVGLIMAGVAAAMIAGVGDVPSLGALWVLQAAIQGIGWPTAARIMINRADKRVLGWYWGLITISGNVGASVAPIFMALLAQHYGWRSIFLGGGALAFTLGLAVYCVLRVPAQKIPSPHPAAVEAVADAAASTATTSAAEASAAARSEVLRSVPIWLMSLCNMACYLPLKALSEWGVVLASEHYGVTVLVASSLLVWHEAGGVLGGFVSPPLSDALGGNRAAAVLACCGLAMVSTALLAATSSGLVPLVAPGQLGGWGGLWVSFLFVTAGVGLAGVKTLAGLHVAEIAPKAALGMSGGIVEMAGQIGAAAAGWPIGLVVASQGPMGAAEGWRLVFVVFTVALAVATVLATSVVLFYGPAPRPANAEVPTFKEKAE